MPHIPAERCVPVAVRLSLRFEYSEAGNERSAALLGLQSTITGVQHRKCQRVAAILNDAPSDAADWPPCTHQA
jgi:hypothetical protein